MIPKHILCSLYILSALLSFIIVGISNLIENTFVNFLITYGITLSTSYFLLKLKFKSSEEPETIGLSFNKDPDFSNSRTPEIDFSISDLSMEELIKFIPEKFLFESKPTTEYFNSIVLIFEHLERDLDIDLSTATTMDLYRNDAHIRLECILSSTDNIECHRVLFKNHVVGFLVGRGWNFRNESLVIHDMEKYRELLSYTKSTYIPDSITYG